MRLMISSGRPYAPSIFHVSFVPSRWVKTMACWTLVLVMRGIGVGRPCRRDAHRCMRHVVVGDGANAPAEHPAAFDDTPRQQRQDWAPGGRLEEQHEAGEAAHQEVDAGDGEAGGDEERKPDEEERPGRRVAGRDAQAAQGEEGAEARAE
jgi:hypothetical protein